MNKHMKKIMSLLIAGAISATSLGLTAFADEPTAGSETTAETTEATAAPEATATAEAADATEAPADATEAPEATATAAPEATAAPSGDTSEGAYAEDSYYHEALTLVEALGIIEGYDDGTVRPTESVTRAQMAAIILRLKNTPESSAYSGAFADVASTAWYASAVQTAYDLGIINGYGDGNFGPEDPVTYEQVYKMLVCAHNREADALQFGGWSTGYMQVGNNLLKLNTNTTGTMGAAADRGLVIKLVYNALLADYAVPSGTDEYGNPKFVVGDTLAAEIFDVYDSTAIIYGTNTSSLINREINDNEIAIYDLERDNYDGYNYEIVTNEVENASDMLGYKVNYFYRTDVYGSKSLVAMFADSRTEALDIDASKIDTFSGFDGDSPTITYEYSDSSSRTRNARISSSVQIVYNGQIITKDDTEYFGEQSFDEYLKPELGTGRLIDNDGDGTYDIMIVEKAFEMLVQSATTTKVNGLVNGETYRSPVTGNTGIDVENDDEEKTITVTKAGEEVRARNLRQNDVAVVTISPDETVINIVVTGETMTGTISSTSEDDNGDTIARINGEDYVIDKNTVDEISLGVEATFYMDTYGRVGYIENSVSSGLLVGTEKYGWVVRVINDTDNDNYTIRIYDAEEGQLTDYTFASNVTFWAADADEPVRLDDPATLVDAYTEYQDIVTAPLDEKTGERPLFGGNELFNVVGGSKGTGTPDEEGDVVKLCKYQANSSGEITRLYMAIPTGQASEETTATPCTFSGIVDNGASEAGLLAGQYSIQESAIEMYVPEVYEDRNSATAYSIGTPNPESYLTREGNNIKVLVAEVDGRVPNLLIRFNESATAVNTEIIDASASNNATFVLSSISEGIDDDDNTIYVMRGYASGNEVEYQTQYTTSLYQTGSSLFGTRVYNGTMVWAPADNIGGDLRDIVNVGDVFVMATSGSNIKSMIQIGNVENIANNRTLSWGNTGQWQSYSFANREGWLFGSVDEVEFDATVTVSVANATTGVSTTGISMDPSKLMSVVEITFTEDEEGNREVTNIDLASEAITPDSIEAYDAESGTGDMILAKSHRGSFVDCYIYRFIKA